MKCGIVFVHGIVGNNRIFDFLKPLVPDDYEVAYVALQGHGGDALGFSKASMSRWKEQVEEAVMNLSAKCHTVIGVGHSMGTLLLMEQAAKGRLSGLFLLNPPMHIMPKSGLFTNIFKVATGNLFDDPVASAAKDAYGISLDCNPLHYYGWPRRYIELFTEIKRVRECIVLQLQCPISVILSERDEMVSPASAEVFKPMANATITMLPHSTHYYYPSEDQRLITTAFRSFIS